MTINSIVSAYSKSSLIRLLLSNVLAQLITVLAQTSPAAATGILKDQGHSIIGRSDGKPLLERSLESARKLNDYTLNSELLTYKKGKAKASSAIMSFKRIKLFRVQVTGSGMQAGSIVVRRADGLIRGKGGNGLSFLTMTLDPDSRLLMTPNDLNVMQTDLLSLLSEARSRASHGDKCRAGTGAIYSDELRQKVQVIDLIAAGKSNELSERLFLRANDNLPAAWEIYKDGKLFSRAKFSNLKINQGLADSLFQM
jgi:hypothetical protein